MRPVTLVQTILLAIFVSFAGATMASALEQRAYDADGFKAAQAAGKPVVIHVTAPWCPTCKAQHQVLDDLAKKPEYASITLYQVDFDSQKDVLKAFKATSQSTLIAFNGATETARVVGQTGAEAIESVLAASTKK
jgi:thiol-disulfide isomerase/thioredoxin